MEALRLEIPACPEPLVARLRRELEVSAALAQVLVRRQLSEPEQARSFLAASEEHPPDAFAGIERAVAVILAHVRERRRITVHGDYDVDGICSTAVLVRALRALGAVVDFYLPDRAGDGYGLATETVRRLAARGTELLVTVDCAITAVEQVAAARALGLQVVVTDHHTPREDGRLPDAPIVHPALCGYPCRELCATAVAHKLAQALWRASGRDVAELNADLDLVALATVADVVPLRGENRTLARRGLKALAATSKPGLHALMAVARVDPSRICERALAFALAPRLNAAGRLHRADAALELLLTDSATRAVEVAQELDRANRERRLVETRIRHAAEAQIARLGELPAYVLADAGWHAGVIGIVASRLSERHRRPVVLIALGAERGKGSGRSIEGFDLLAGLSACGGHLLRYGGHRAAAGIEIEVDRVGGFAAALCEHAERVISPEAMQAVERVDAVVGGDEVGMALAEELRGLAPFGQGNPPVSLLVQEARFRDLRPMGEGKHVRFMVESCGARARAVAFGTGGRLPVAEGALAQATFALEINEWGGVSEPRLVLRHAQPATLAGQLTLQPAASAGAELAAPDGVGDARHGVTPPRQSPLPARRPRAAAEAAEHHEELVLFAMP